MVEDALKSTRNVQRLLLVACSVAIAFLGSLEDISEERRMLHHLKALQSLGSRTYASEIETLVVGMRTSGVDATVRAFLDGLASQLRSHGVRSVHGIERITAAISQPAWVGRLEPEELPFADEELTVAEIVAALRPLPTGRDVELVWAKPDDRFIERIAAFLGGVAGAESHPERLRIENVTLVPAYPVDLEGHSFLGMVKRPFLPLQSRAREGRFEERGTTPLRLSFDVLGSSGQPARFEGVLTGSLVELPDSSWMRHMGKKNIFDRYINIAISSRTMVGRGRAAWVSLRSLWPREPLDRNEPIGALKKKLEARIERAEAANRTIDIIGLSIPGALAVVGIPVVLLSLAVSLLLHLQHLERLVAAHRSTFRCFSWIPFAPGRVWAWECVLVVIAMPFFAHLLLFLKAPAFGRLGLAAFVLAAAGAVAILAIGSQVLRTVRRVRRKLYLR